jgi:hypothetical protein
MVSHTAATPAATNSDERARILRAESVSDHFPKGCLMTALFLVPAEELSAKVEMSRWLERLLAMVSLLCYISKDLMRTHCECRNYILLDPRR